MMVKGVVVVQSLPAQTLKGIASASTAASVENKLDTTNHSSSSMSGRCYFAFIGYGSLTQLMAMGTVSAGGKEITDAAGAANKRGYDESRISDRDKGA